MKFPSQHFMVDDVVSIIYIMYSQDTVIDNIIAILYECEMCAV